MIYIEQFKPLHERRSVFNPKGKPTRLWLYNNENLDGVNVKLIFDALLWVYRKENKKLIEYM